MRDRTSIQDAIEAKATMPALLSELAFGEGPALPAAAAVVSALHAVAPPRHHHLDR